jgi:hypothetical protein
MRPRALLIAAFIALACNHESPTSPGLPSDPFTRPAALLGNTVDRSGTPVANVEVRLTANDVLAGRAVSGNDGSFRIDDLQAGTYAVRLRVDGGAEQDGGRVSLLGGTNRHDVLVSACIIPYGTVRDAVTGLPIAGAKVRIFFRETTTDAAGRYKIDFGCEYVPGSTITMNAEHPDYLPMQTLTRASFLCTCAYDFLLTHR